MKVSVKDTGACRKTVKIEVPVEAVNEERTETLSVYAKHANVPGFRKGKAPAHVIAKKFAKEIKKDLEEHLVPKFYQKAQEESNLKVVNVIDVSDIDLKDDQPLSYEVVVDVEPEFKLPKYTDITLKVTKEEVTDEQVQAQIDEIRKQHATYEEVEGKAVEANDMAQLTYEATVKGQPLEEVAPKAKGIGKGAGYWVSADDHAFLPGMGEAIIGLSIGDKKEIEVDFPETFMINELAGVKAVYNVEVTAVRVRALPEIDEAFLGRLQVQSEEELRSHIRSELEKQAENKLLNDKHEQIIAYLIKKTKLEVPQSVVQQQTRNAMYELAQRRMMMGMTQEQIGEKQEELFKEAEERALENVKLRYIGLGIAKDIGVEASKSEIDEEIAAMAVRQRKDARELRHEMVENNSLDHVAEQILFNKALDFMVENAKLK